MTGDGCGGLILPSLLSAADISFYSDDQFFDRLFFKRLYVAIKIGYNMPIIVAFKDFVMGRRSSFYSMKSMLVIGMGRFGSNLALKLMELGNQVMIIDECEECIQKLASFVTSARIGDCMDEDVIKSLGVNNFDICFVCIGENFQSSLEITSQLKDHGAKYVVAKTDRDIQAKFLQRIGADDVIYPERDMALRTAVKYSTRHAFDYIELAPEFGIYEIEMPPSWVGKTLRELSVRSKYGINVIALKSDGHISGLPGADHICKADEHLIIAGNKDVNMRVLEKIDR